MYLKIGAYQHAVGESSITIDKTFVYQQGGLLSGIRQTWTINGVLEGDTPDEVTAAIRALESAYLQPGQTVGLYLDNGDAAAHVLDSNQMQFVRVQRIAYPIGDKNEYVNQRTYEITLDTLLPTDENGNPKKPNPGGQGLVLQFSQQFSFSGGGPLFTHLVSLTGLPQKQILAQYTPFKATQSGTARGLGTWPQFPRALWPSDEHLEQRQQTRSDPEIGQSGDREYAISWSYSFESATPLA
jgi:hypothetical protein